MHEDLQLEDLQTLKAKVVELTAANNKLQAENAELKSYICNFQNLQKFADESSKAKSAFLANISHELRTPLNIILGYSEILRDEAKAKQQEARAELEMVCDEARHLSSLIDHILEIAKIESGQIVLHPETFDIASLVHDLVSIIQPTLEKNHNSIVVYCARNVGMMHSDHHKLRGTLLNLLNNACKFTKDGQVRLTVRKDEVVVLQNEEVKSCDFIIFSVADSGIGMTEAEIDMIFQPFTQIDNSTTRQYAGIGLGLAIAKKLCQMMGGDITAESEYGRGSTFVMRLPAKLP